MKCPKTIYGVFPWNAQGRYSRGQAVKTYKRRSSADKFAGKKNLVVRTLDADTGNQIFNVPKGCKL